MVATKTAVKDSSKDDSVKNTKDISENADDAAETPLSNNFGEAVKRLLKRGKERGFVTVDEINATLPPERVSSEQIEDVLAQLSELGVNVVEGEDGEEAEETKAEAESDYGRTDDPVRLYLREMGQVELLSREGEIAIAKRIEAGREMMISGICESPLTIQAILDWNQALKDGRLLLRDIVDLEAMQENENGGPAIPAEAMAEEAAAPAPAAEPAEGVEGEGADISGFDDEDNFSLAAVEEKLKPQVIETFDGIASTYKKLSKAQHARMDALSKGEKPDKKIDDKVITLKHELVDLVRTVRFNNARLEQLVQQMYTLNRRLMGLEGKILRLALDVGLTRDEFLERYYGHELDPNFYDHVLLEPPPPPPPAPKETKTHASILAAITRPLTRAQAKAAEKERQRLEKEAKKQAALEAKAAAKAAKIAAKEAAHQAAIAAKQAAAEAKAKLKAKQEAEREKMAAKKEAERLKKQAQRERELAKKEALREKLAEKRERELAKKEAARKAAEKAKLEAAKKKAAAEKIAKAKKLAAEKAAKAKKIAAQKAAAKKKAPVKKAPVKKAGPAPKKKSTKKPAKKPASKSKKR